MAWQVRLLQDQLRGGAKGAQEVRQGHEGLRLQPPGPARPSTTLLLPLLLLRPLPRVAAIAASCADCGERVSGVKLALRTARTGRLSFVLHPDLPDVVRTGVLDVRPRRPRRPSVLDVRHAYRLLGRTLLLEYASLHTVYLDVLHLSSCSTPPLLMCVCV